MPTEYVSPGAEFSKAMQEQMLLRMQLQRQAEQSQMDRERLELARTGQANDIERGKKADARETAAEARANSADARAQEALDYSRVQDVVEDAGADTTLGLDTPEAALLKKFRPERIAQETTAEQGALENTDENGIPNYKVLPGVLHLRPGAKFENQRATEAARKEAAEATAQARKETLEAQIAERTARNQQSDDLKRELAGLTTGFRQQGLDIQRQGMELRQSTADDKKQEAADAKEKTRASMQQYGDDMLSVLDALVATDPKTKRYSLKPGAQGIYGSMQGRVPGALVFDEAKQNALADVDRLMAMLDINTLREMKSQSRTGATGFGALSEKELAIIEGSAAKLRNRKIGDADALKEMNRIRDVINRSRATGKTPDATSTTVDPANAKSLREKYGY